MTKAATLTGEQKLRNVANAMLEFSQVKRQWNGKGRSSTYVGSTNTLALTGRQLAEMILAHLDGQLPDSTDDGSPF